MRRFVKVALMGFALATAGAAALGAVDALTSLTGPEPWPNDTRGLVGAAALALTLALGLAGLIRLVLDMGGPGSRSKPTAHEFARLHSEARTDTLTRLPNRRAFDDDLAAEIDRRNRTGSVFCLMAVDLDGLKEVNDTHGHQAGDARLCATAASLESVVGRHGTVYRTGGDEFMILLPGSRNWHAIELAHRIHEATESATGGRALSVGVTETRGTEHRQELVRQADAALYEAKRARLPAVPYQPGLETSALTPVDRAWPKQRALAAALSRLVDARDGGESSHSEAVAAVAVAIGSRLGIGGRRLDRLRVAALMHDIGTLAVPDSILHKEETLEPGELEAIRSHVAIGHDVVEAAGFTEEATWVLRHHEAHDGSGYPDGLSRGEIPLEARIIAIADAFEALSGSQPHRESLTPEAALVELAACSGTQFDPACVDALTAVVAAGGARRPGFSAGAARAR